MIMCYIDTLVLTLGMVFLILKSCNAIDWSWWVVSIPFFIVIVGSILMITLYILSIGSNKDEY